MDTEVLRTDTTKEKVRRVFSFLRELHQLRSKLVRRVQDHTWHVELRNLPADPRVACTRDSTPEGAEELFRLSVKRVTLAAPPRPPDELRPSLSKGWDDPAKANVAVDLPDDPEATALVQGLFDEWHPRRERWAAECKPDLGVHRAFQMLYEVWTQLERESESWDLVLADVFLDAPAANDQGGRIQHPVVLQRVDIHFDADAGTIEVVEADADPRLHGAMLRISAGLSDVGLRPVQERLAAGGVRLNDGRSVADYARFLAASLFPQNGRVLDHGEQPDHGVTVRAAPMLVLMRRVPGIAEAIERYLTVLDEVDDLPAGLRRVVGDFVEAEHGPHHGGAKVEVLLTKHANADQEQIVRRLDAHGSVLVQGPPGTGKTHTIANLIGHLLAHGKTVLVTSHTTKALRVVREQVVEELRPLCVSVLERDTAARNELEASIGGIVGEFTRTSTAQLDAEIASGRDKRARLLQRIETLEASFRQTCEVRGTTLDCGGRSWTLEEAARWLREREGQHGWIHGSIDVPAPLAIIGPEVDRLYHLNALLTDEEIAKLSPPLPDVREFTSADSVEERVKLLAALARGDAGPAYAHPDARDRGEVRAAAIALSSVCALIKTGKGLDQWQRVVAEDAIVGGGRAAVWTDLMSAVASLRQRAVALAAVAAKFRPKVGLDWQIHEQVAVAWAVHAHVSRGGTIGVWIRVSQSRWWTFVQAVSVGGRPPGTAEEFEAVAALLELERDQRVLAEQWDLVVGPHGGPTVSAAPGDFLEAAQVWADDIRRSVEWATSLWEMLLSKIQQVQGLNMSTLLADLRPTDLQLPRHSVRRLHLNRVEAGVRAHCLALLVEGIETWFRDAVARATRAQVAGDATGVGRRLLDALQRRDVEVYRRERESLAPLSERRRLVVEREVLLGKLAAGAPDWARLLIRRIEPHGAAAPPGPADTAIAWKRLHRAFDERVALDPVAIQRELSEHRAALRVATAGYVRARAWRAQRDRVDGRRQQRLVGWVDTVRRIGRGTGVRAPRLMAEARRLLAECRDSVPVWIMPLAQALESYDLARARFDVVIIDEASQLDIVGVVALALGKQVVVVGDHEQVSPSAIGEQVAPVDALQRQYLAGVPNAHLYVGKTSVYDLARQSFGEMIRLREHFRCAREIIEFSNQLCYGGEIVALRETSGVSQLPHVVPVRTPGARLDREKVNHQEAETVVALLVAMLERPEYRDSTFGVISLLGEDQARLIDQIVAQRIPPQERQRRRLVCGTAAQFQGDEREVMLLSMVDSGTGQGPLAMNDRPEFRQRLNVAASRAQNQQWVVHSLNPAIDLKPHDLRRTFLEYAANSRGYVETLNRAIDAAESPFEREVIRRLLAAGYRLFPQFQVGAYRIDMVVEGEFGKRLAIECDGDRYHGLDETQRDLERQNLLERLGWRFHRIRGGSFYRDPDAEMRKLEAALADRGIAPPGTRADDAPAGPTLADLVLSRSVELVATWRAEGGTVGAATRQGSDPTKSGAEHPPDPIAVPPDDQEEDARIDDDEPTGERLHSQPRRAPSDVPQDNAARLLAGIGSDWRSQSDLLALVPMEVPEWNRAMHDLLDRQLVDYEEEKRGRRYRRAGISNGRSQAAPATLRNATTTPVSAPATQPAERTSSPAAAGPDRTPGAARAPGDLIKAALRGIDPQLGRGACPSCGTRMELFVGKRGPFVKCQQRECELTVPVAPATLEQAVRANPAWACATCGKELAVAVSATRTWVRCAAGHREEWQDLRTRIAEASGDVTAAPGKPQRVRLPLTRPTPITELRSPAEFDAFVGMPVALIGLYRQIAATVSGEIEGDVAVWVAGVDVKLDSEQRDLEEIRKYAGKAVRVSGVLGRVADQVEVPFILRDIGSVELFRDDKSRHS